jgi:hypothetical protein
MRKTPKRKGRYVMGPFRGERVWLKDTSIRPRKITTRERAWLIRGLNSLRTGAYVGTHAINLDLGTNPPPGPPVDPQPYLDQIDKLIVVKKCRCGQKNCYTVTFRQSHLGRSVGLVMHYTEDDRRLIICVNNKSRELSELEII